MHTTSLSSWKAHYSTSSRICLLFKNYSRIFGPGLVVYACSSLQVLSNSIASTISWLWSQYMSCANFSNAKNKIMKFQSCDYSFNCISNAHENRAQVARPFLPHAGDAIYPVLRKREGSGFETISIHVYNFIILVLTQKWVLAWTLYTLWSFVY